MKLQKALQQRKEWNEITCITQARTLHYIEEG